jgi:hypothetical protein
MNKLFADSIKTPYLPELKLDADPWVKTQREREFRFLCNQRQTIYFNYQSIQAFKGRLLTLIYTLVVFIVNNLY